MSVTLIPSFVPQVVGGAQAAVSSAATVANILAGLLPPVTATDALNKLNKDISGFAFDYIGEERLEAGTEITDHYSETNEFMQDHIAVKPAFVVMRGFVAEQTVNKAAFLPTLTALATALTPITPYLGQYSPGAAALMGQAVNQTTQIIQQISRISSLYGSASKLISAARGLTKVQQAFNTLDELRTSGVPFVVVTPWATFGARDTLGNLPHGLMMIENLVMVAPEETRGWADIVVRLKEIRVAPSLLTQVQDNARAPGASVAAPAGSTSGRGGG